MSGHKVVFDPDKALEEARDKTGTDKKIVIDRYTSNWNNDTLAVDVTLSDFKDNKRMEYNFVGDLPENEVYTVIDIIKRNQGVIPVVEARKLWDILIQYCTLSTNAEEKTTLWG